MEQVRPVLLSGAGEPCLLLRGRHRRRRMSGNMVLLLVLSTFSIAPLHHPPEQPEHPQSQTTPTSPCARPHQIISCNRVRHPVLDHFLLSSLPIRSPSLSPLLPPPPFVLLNFDVAPHNASLKLHSADMCSWRQRCNQSASGESCSINKRIVARMAATLQRRLALR